MLTLPIGDKMHPKAFQDLVSFKSNDQLLIESFSHPFKWLLSFIIIIAIGLSNDSIAANDMNGALDKATIEDRLSIISSDSNLTDEDKAKKINILQQVIQYIDKTTEVNKQTNNYKNSLSNGPIEQLQLAQKSKDYQTPTLPDKLANTSLSNLETRLAKETLSLSEWRNRVTQINAEINEEKALNLQELLQDAKKKVAEIDREQLNVLNTEANSDLLQISKLASLKYYQAIVSMLEQRLASRAIRLDLLTTEQELLTKKITGATLRQSTLQNKVSSHRYNEAQSLLISAQSMLANKPNLSPALMMVANQNITLATELKSLIANYDQVLNKVESTEKEALRFSKKYTSLTEQLKITQLGSSPAFGAALREQRDNLVDSTISKKQLDNYEQTLTQSRLGQFKVDTERDTDIQDDLTHDQSKPDIDDDPATKQAILKLRDQLLKTLASSYVDHIDALSKLITQIRTLHNQSQLYAQLLEQELVWMPSHDLLNLTTIIDAMKETTPLMSSFLSLDFINQFLIQIKQFSIRTVLSLGLLIFLFTQRSKLIQRLTQMKQRVGKVNIDSFILTVKALVITILLSLFLPFIFYTIAVQIKSQSEFYHPFATALTYSAAVYLFLEFLSQSLRKSGLADLHFKWPSDKQRLLRGHLNWFKWAFLIVITLTSYAELSLNANIRDSLGRVSFITAAMISTYFIFRTCNLKNGLLQLSGSGQTLWSMNGFIFSLLLLLPFTLAILSATGFHYMAYQLAIYLLQSIIIIIFGVYLYFFARRLFSINERQLMYDRALKKRALAAKQSDMVFDPDLVTIEPEESNIHTISQQTASLIKMLIGIAMAFALWHIWAELLFTFQKLDNIYLWGSFEIVDGISVSSGLSLWAIILAVVLTVITFLAARNIPGLLEIAVLSHWAIEPGTKYAITTLSRYFIVITGSLIILQLLGAQWSKLQWLVAALSVGLGFGLQEIVANFVSGIVILFERPIRIGDTVTIGDQFGTVSQIRIRATTVVDWDRKEIIIPNKTFITERLVNWSLSDPIIRTTIRVGVSYGSDTELTEKCLLEIATNNNKVLSDPAPVAWFREFGDNSLNFELRVFIKGIQDLNPVTHEIHNAIDKLFRHHNIEIAFPQRDIHFDSKPLEIHLVKPNRTTGQDD